jgi:hypothetical protein
VDPVRLERNLQFTVRELDVCRFHVLRSCLDSYDLKIFRIRFLLFKSDQ